MKNKLLEWLKSNKNQPMDFDDNKNRLTIKPKDDFVTIKYWEPRQIKGTSTYFWYSISEIRITPEFLESCDKYDELAEFLFEKLSEGGNHEVRLKKPA